jgi:nucleoside diphosphate kinase
MQTFQEYLDATLEALKKKIVFRGGKKLVLKKTDKKGFKVVDGKEVKMSPKEIKNRKLASKKSAKKRKATSAKAVKKRMKSMKKRKAAGQ